ncbi:MAG: glycosyltransferase family 4 protein [Bacillota bacterium]
MVSGNITVKKRGRQVKLLSLAPYPPFLICPPISGGAIHIIKPLIALGSTGNYQITLLFPASSQEHAGQVKGYLDGRPGFKKVEGVVCERQRGDDEGAREWVPDGALFLFCSRQYSQSLERTLQEGAFDIVVVETSYLAWTVPVIRKILPKARVVLDLQNVEHLIMKRMVKNGNLSGPAREKYVLEYRKTFNWEKRFWPEFDFCMAVSPLEAELFSKYAPAVPVEVVVAGGGIEAESHRGRVPIEGISPADIAYVGTMWYPNVHGLLWFIEKVFPRVRTLYPRTRLHIVGSGRPPASLLSVISGSDSIVYWGQVRDDRSILARAGVFVVPLFIGAGTRIKIMTAWSLELPVVSTSIGAEGLSCKDGIDIMIADTPGKFAAGIVKLLSDPLLREAIGRNGRRLVEERYSERVAIDRIINLFSTVSKIKLKPK